MDNETGNNSQETAPQESIEDRIMATLDFEDDEAAPAVEAEIETTDEPDEDTEEVANSEAEPEEIDEDDAPDEEITQPTDNTKFKVKVDGQELDVERDELVNGYQRQSDYTKGKQALAEERKALYEEYHSQINQLGIELKNKEEPNWDDLRNEDEVLFLNAREQWRSDQERAVQVKEIQNQNLKKYADEQFDLIVERIPEWANEEVAKNEAKAVSDYGQTLGFSTQEIDKLYDHRSVDMMRKAMKYDELMSGKEKAQNAVKDVPKVVKPGATKPTTKARNSNADLQKRARKTGNVDDFAALIESGL